jgi:MFS family permease
MESNARGASVHIARADSEWRRNWLLVLAGVAGMSITGMVPYSIGLFMDPLTAAFGWSRGFTSSGLTVIAIFGILLTPLVGVLSDRFGPRSIAIPGIVLTSLAFAALGLTSASTLIWLLLWGVYGIVFVAVKPLVWSAAVAQSFARGRGLAFAITLSGAAISQTLTPIIAEWLIRTYGWRQAFCWLGLGWGLVVLLIVFLFFKVRPGATGLASGQAPGFERHHPAVTTLFDTLDANIAKIAVASFLLAAIGAGTAVHKVPILGEFGVDRATAAWLAATAGVSGIVGKVVMGWLMDRSKSHVIGAFGMGVTGIGVALLLPPGHPHAMIVAAMLTLGFGAGASLQVAVYLVSQFAGPGNFGRAFGIVSALMAVGAGVGPWLFGVFYSSFGSYHAVLIASVPIAIACSLLIATLGPLPEASE